MKYKKDVVTKLDSIDKKIINFCKFKPKSISEISRYVKLHHCNISRRVTRLKKLNQLQTTMFQSGKKKFVFRPKNQEKVKEYLIHALKNIYHKKYITSKELNEILLFDIHENFALEKDTAFFLLKNSGLLENVFVVSAKGKELLSEFQKIKIKK